jgi:hypothetical protein
MGSGVENWKRDAAAGCVSGKRRTTKEADGAVQGSMSEGTVADERNGEAEAKNEHFRQKSEGNGPKITL